MQIAQKSPIIQELRQEWIEEGERKATLEALYRILAIRFDAVLREFDERFGQFDLKSLKQLNEVALKVQTLIEFEDALADMLSTVEVLSSSDENEQ